ncbi:MAG TPA: glycosyltransferase family 9 protein [Candidatus Obscuribacterales bacterium]
MAVYIAPAAMGLGDLVVALPVVQSAIAHGEKVYLVIRLKEHLPLAQRISGLSGVILEWQLDPTRLKTNDVFYDLRDHYLQKRYWWGSRQFIQAYPGYKINDILSIICSDLGLEVDFDKLTILQYNKRSEVRNSVLFIPGSAIDAKCWSHDAWLKLADQLQSQGTAVGVIGEPENSWAVSELLTAGLHHHATPTIADALDLLSSCRAVVSVDTGLMHLAVHQSIPTVGIFRRDPVYVRNFPNFQSVITPKQCSDACYQREAQSFHHHRPLAGPHFRPANWSCQTVDGGHCLSSISAASVMEALEQVLNVGTPV